MHIPLEPIENDPIIVAAGYHRQTSTLRLTLAMGRTVDLPGVSEREAKALFAATEMGKHYKARVWPMYGARTVQPNEMTPAEEQHYGSETKAI